MNISKEAEVEMYCESSIAEEEIVPEQQIELVHALPFKCAFCVMQELNNFIR